MGMQGGRGTLWGAEAWVVRVYTIGHSNHPEEKLVGLLGQHGVELVVDVRSRPYSRWVPQANRERLAQTLEAAGIEYRWLGEALGGKPGPGGSGLEGAAADYEALRARPEFEAGIEEVVALAAERRTAILCAEGDYRKCHRYKLIAPSLEARGVEVAHIQPDGTVADEGAGPRQMGLF